MVNWLRAYYHFCDHRSPWHLHHFLHHELNFTLLYTKDSGTRNTIKKSNKCLPMHTDLAFPPLFYRRSLTHAVFVTQNAFQIFFPWQKYSWGLRRWGLRGGGGGRRVGATMETYMTHIGLYIALLFSYCTDVIHFGGQNISSWLAQILHALILKELNMSRYRPMKITLVK